MCGLFARTEKILEQCFGVWDGEGVKNVVFVFLWDHDHQVARNFSISFLSFQISYYICVFVGTKLLLKTGFSFWKFIFAIFRKRKVYSHNLL